MRIIYAVLVVLLLSSCKGNDTVILNEAVGKINKVLIVTSINDWQGNLGKTIRNSFGELQVGLPQPEPILSVSQIAPSGFGSMMKSHRNILVINYDDEEKLNIKYNVYAKPQVIIFLQAKDEASVSKLFEKNKEKIIKTYLSSDIKFLQSVFKKNKLDDSKYELLKKLGVSLTINKNFRIVDNTSEFLWLRQHLVSGVAKTGSNNILMYSLPMMDENKIADNIVKIRDSIGKKFIPGSKEGMYMITEEAYTPFTFKTKIDGKLAFETRGKWEVKNDFMAGPFLNYIIVDKPNNRLVVFEGFTYAPSINKRAFIFELEAAARSIKIK